MNFIDIIVIIAATSLLLGVGYFASARKPRDTNNFIVGGRRLPWWLGGTAMIAGGTNADSPIHQSGKIHRDGLPGAWFYWSQAIAQTWHALVFARLWRRTEINTVVEFYAIRYSGSAAVAGRVWSMVFASFIESTLVLALGLLAMIKICPILLGISAPLPLFGLAVPPELVIVIAGVGLAVGYSMVSGLFGVVAGDIVEFGLIIGSSYLLMFFAYREVGYAEGLRAGLEKLGRSELLSLQPTGGIAFATFLILQPLATLAGNNTLNQRFLAIRDEREAMLSGVWRIVHHFFIRCWPWYICGLAAVVLFSQAKVVDEQAYARLIVDCVPAGFRGLMFAALLVSFMSSASGAIHTSGSVFVNDFYRPYVRRDASERHYLWVIRGAMLIVTVVATFIALTADHILHLLQFAMTMSSAAGLAMLLRWFWWRVNGWADLAAQVLSLPLTFFFMYGPGQQWVQGIARFSGSTGADGTYGITFCLTIAANTLAWLVVMRFTPSEPLNKLAAFHERVRPYGWWGPVTRQSGSAASTDSFQTDLRRYGLGLLLGFGLLFGMGMLLLGYLLPAFITLLMSGLAGYRLIRSIGTKGSPPVNG